MGMVKVMKTRARIAGALYAVIIVLSGLGLTASLPVRAHTDPWVEPTTGGNPDPVGQGQPFTVTGNVGCILFGCPMRYAEMYILPEMAGVFPGAGNHDAVGAFGIELLPTDGSWTLPSAQQDEAVYATNDTSYLSQGAKTVYVRVLGNNQHQDWGVWWSQWFSFTFTVSAPTSDTTPPAQLNAHFEPDNIINGTDPRTVTLAATMDDTGDPQTATIAGAEWWYSGCGTQGTGTAMAARDGTFDEEIEDVVATIDTTGYPDGVYLYYLKGWDSLGNYPIGGVECISAELYIQAVPADTTPPKAWSGYVSPFSINVGGGPVEVRAQIEDYDTGGSNIGRAEFFVDPDPATGSPNPPPYVDDAGTKLLPEDGLWDEIEEWSVEYAYDVSTWGVGVYTFYIHGRDQWGNWGRWTNPAEYTVGVLTIGTPAPQSPTNIQLTVQGNDLRLSWTAPSPSSGLDHYNVYRGAAPSAGPAPSDCPVGTLAASPSSGSTTWTDFGAAANLNSYFYLLRASNAMGAEDSGCGKVGKIGVSLRPGVNEISTPFLPTDPAPTTVFAPVMTPFLGVGAFSGSGWVFYNKTGGGALAAIDRSMGLRVVMGGAANLALVGAVPTSNTIAVQAGWNFLGMPSWSPGTLPGLFDNNGISGLWTRALLLSRGNPHDPWRQYSVSDSAFRDLTSLSEGDGFWLQCTSAGTWTPPVT